MPDKATDTPERKPVTPQPERTRQQEEEERKRREEEQRKEAERRKAKAEGREGESREGEEVEEHEFMAPDVKPLDAIFAEDIDQVGGEEAIDVPPEPETESHPQNVRELVARK